MRKLFNIVKPISISISCNFRVPNVSKQWACLPHRSTSSQTDFSKGGQEDLKSKENAVDNPLIDFKGEWPLKELEQFKNDMKLLPEFISELEETQLFEEVEPYMARLRYEFDHWDNAIHGFRETERKHWYPNNRAVLQRVSQVGFEGKIMPYIHILDLAPQGVIKPHVDSVRYCGHTIAGLSLLSDAVMRLVRTSNDGKQNSAETQDEDNYRSQSKTVLENNFYADILLPRRSLYIMSHTARYNYTHEILANEESRFLGQPLIKDRRISIICRNDP